jgi:hypothetical protein
MSVVRGNTPLRDRARIDGGAAVYAAADSYAKAERAMRVVLAHYLNAPFSP